MRWAEELSHRSLPAQAAVKRASAAKPAAKPSAKVAASKPNSKL